MDFHQILAPEIKAVVADMTILVDPAVARRSLKWEDRTSGMTSEKGLTIEFPFEGLQGMSPAQSPELEETLKKKG